MLRIAVYSEGERKELGVKNKFCIILLSNHIVVPYVASTLFIVLLDIIIY